MEDGAFRRRGEASLWLVGLGLVAAAFGVVTFTRRDIVGA